ncbi:hypothetical protein [Microbacterium mcarthurae (nom. nud.)]|uniref:Uncharacterized protein n=1 Tax=Microbacterium mcarthurae TaxID=3035918 RepID=A0ABW9GK97_9MICO
MADDFDSRIRRALDAACMDEIDDIRAYALLGSEFEWSSDTDRLLAPILVALIQVAQSAADAQGLTRREFVMRIRQKYC